MTPPRTTLKRVQKRLFETQTASFSSLVENQKHAYLTARGLVQAFYAFTLILFVRWLSYHWPIWLESKQFDLLWPVAWILPFQTPALYVIGFFCLGGGILAVLFPQKRWVRFLLFLAFLQFVSIWNSFGRISHSLHAWLWISFIFVLLPDSSWLISRNSISQRQRFLFIFWGAQMLLALFYSMSGLIKVYVGIEQVMNGEVSIFHPHALAYVVANRLLQNGSESILGPLIVTYPLLGWPFYIAAVWIELLALVAVFRPTLHRLWGVGLLLLHMGNWLFLSILFDDQMMLCLLFLVYSPFHPQKITLREWIDRLPLVATAARLTIRNH